MLGSAPEAEKQPLIEHLEKQSLTKVLKDSLGTADPELKKEIFKYLVRYLHIHPYLSISIFNLFFLFL